MCVLHMGHFMAGEGVPGCRAPANVQCIAFLMQVMLFIGGVLDTEEEVTRVLTPFGPIVRTAIVTNPVVSAVGCTISGPC